MNKVLRKVAPHDCFKWATRAEEVETEVVVAMSDYDGHCLREAGIDKPGILKARGYRFDTAVGTVIPTYSPWLVGKGKMNLIPVLIHDILRAIDEEGQPKPEFPMADLSLYPTPDDFAAWCKRANEREFISHDIETPFSRKVDDENDMDPSFEILRFSLADNYFRAITCPFIEPFVSIWREFAAHYEGVSVGWNSHEFDDPREHYNGVFIGGRRHDAQWIWHFMSPMLPRGLGHVSTYYDRVPEWKSIGSSQENENAELYAAMDARQTAVNYAGMKRAMEGRAI